MGREQPSAGEAAEDHARGFLRRSFQDLQKSQPGAAVDWACHGLRRARASSEAYRDPTLNFLVQVKGCDAFPKEISVARPTFEYWLRHSETQPVFVLLVREVRGNRQEYLFLCFHDWLLTSPGQAAICNRHAQVSLRRKDFTKSDPDGDDLHAKLLEEADRALRVAGSPWVTLRDFGLLPFDEALFHEYMELASFAEPPTRVVKLLAREGFPSAPTLTRRLLQGEAAGDQELTEWANAVRALAPPPSLTSFQRTQFRHFSKTIKNLGRGLPLPAFRVAEVNCWRAMVAMYPHAIYMIEHAIRHSKREGDIIFASAMLPMLALSSDRGIRQRAFEAIQMLYQRRDLSPSYAFRRELCRGPAEAGDERALAEAIAILKSRGAAEHERSFLEGYGWPSEVLGANLDRKLRRPAIRDEQLKPFYLVMGELLLERDQVA